MILRLYLNTTLSTNNFVTCSPSLSITDIEPNANVGDWIYEDYETITHIFSNYDSINETIIWEEFDINTKRRNAYNQNGATIEALTVAMWENNQSDIDDFEAIRQQVKIDYPNFPS